MVAVAGAWHAAVHRGLSHHRTATGRRDGAGQSVDLAAGAASRVGTDQQHPPVLARRSGPAASPGPAWPRASRSAHPWGTHPGRTDADRLGNPPGRGSDCTWPACRPGHGTAERRGTAAPDRSLHGAVCGAPSSRGGLVSPAAGKPLGAGRMRTTWAGGALADPGAQHFTSIAMGPFLVEMLQTPQYSVASPHVPWSNHLHTSHTPASGRSTHRVTAPNARPAPRPAAR